MQDLSIMSPCGTSIAHKGKTHVFPLFPGTEWQEKVVREHGGNIHFSASICITLMCSPALIQSGGGALGERGVVKQKNLSFSQGT